MYFDTTAMEAQLLPEKLQRLRMLVTEWTKKSKATKCGILSLGREEPLFPVHIYIYIYTRLLPRLKGLTFTRGLTTNSDLTCVGGIHFISVKWIKTLKVEHGAAETRCHHPDGCFRVMGLRSILPRTVATMAMVAGMNINRDNAQRTYPQYSKLCCLGQTIVAPESPFPM